MPDPWDFAGSYNAARQGAQKTAAGDIELQGQQLAGETLKSLYQGMVPGAQPMPGQQPPSAPPSGVGGAPQAVGGLPGGPGAPPQPMGGQPQQQNPIAAILQRLRGTPQGGGMPQGQPGQPPMGGAPQGGGMPPGGMPQGGQPQGQQQGQLDWKTIIQKVVASGGQNAKNPAVVAAAVDKFIPLMNAQSQQEWRQIGMELRAMQVGQGEQRVQQSGQRVEQGQQRLDERQREFDIREKRLEARDAVSKDVQHQRLAIQTQNLERQITEGNKRQLLGQWRAALDAQHKRAMEIIQSASGFSTLDPKERKALLDEQNQNYAQALEDMRTKVGSSTPTGGTAAPAPKPKGKDGQVNLDMKVKGDEAVTEPKKVKTETVTKPDSGKGPVKVTSPEEAAKLKPGTKYLTPDGQEYTR